MLTDKQKKFVNEYLIDLNGTQSAIRSGYSKQSAKSIATENLSKPVIQEAIEKAMEEQKERTEITADWILKQLKHEAEFSDQSSGRIRSLELLGKHLGLFQPKTDLPKENEVIEIGIFDRSGKKIIDFKD